MLQAISQKNSEKWIFHSKNKVIVLVLCMLTLHFTSYSQFWKCSKTIDKEVISYVEEHFIQNGSFLVYQDSIPRPLPSQGVKGLYHIFHLETRDFDSVKVSLFQIGVNYSHMHDYFLIARKYKDKKIAFQIIGRARDIKNTIMLFDFFIHYKKFSERTELNCYQLAVMNLYYFYLDSIDNE